MAKPLIIFIDIVEKVDFESGTTKGAYSNPLLARIKLQNPDILYYEMDNLSEGIVIDYAIRAIQLVENVCIIFLIKEQAKLHKLRSFQESLIASKNKLHVLVLGKHPNLERLLKPLGDNKLHTIRELDAWPSDAWNWYQKLAAGL